MKMIIKNEGMNDTWAHHLTLFIGYLETVLLIIALIIWFIIGTSYPHDVFNKNKTDIFITWTAMYFLLISMIIGFVSSILLISGTRKRKISYIIPSIISHCFYLTSIQKMSSPLEAPSLAAIAYLVVCLPVLIARCIELRKTKNYEKMQDTALPIYEAPIELHAIHATF